MDRKKSIKLNFWENERSVEKYKAYTGIGQKQGNPEKMSKNEN